MERRRLSFRTSGLVIELEITGSGESRQMAGRLIPAQPGVVEIRGVVAVEADARGRFTADDSPPGTPAQALAENRGPEVRRRAQAEL